MTNIPMPLLNGTLTRSLLATAILFTVSNIAMATSEGPGVSHALAITRAARLSNLRYQLSFTLKEHESAVAGTETLSFESKSAGDLPIDYRDGVLQSATLNGHAIPTQLENGHLNLPVIAGQNGFAKKIKQHRIEGFEAILIAQIIPEQNVLLEK